MAMNVRAVIAEWRDSLPDVLAGRDPIDAHPMEFYRARLLRYGADMPVTESTKRFTAEGQAAVVRQNAVPVPSQFPKHSPDSISSSHDGREAIERSGQGVGKASQTRGRMCQGND